MKDKTELAHKLDQAVNKWQSELSLAQYARDHLAQFDNGKTKAGNVLDSLYNIAMTSDKDETKINAAETLLKIASADQKPTTQINQQFNSGHLEFVLKKEA